MKKYHVDINFKDVLRRIEKEMDGYSRTEWANKVGVKINVVSNIHSAKASQNPSLNYILAVSVATGKPMDYFLWGHVFYQTTDPLDKMVKEDVPTYPHSETNKDPEMGKRVRYWREDMGFSIAEVSKRSGLPVDQIKRIEAGYHTSTDVILKLANTLRCSIDFLLGCGVSSVSHHPNQKGKRR